MSAPITEASADTSIGNMLHVADWHQQRAETCVPGTSDWRWHTRTAGILRAVAKERDDHMRALTASEKRAHELDAGMRALYRGYVSTLESARDRITTYGGTCDDVPTMEAGDPALRDARAILAKGET